MINRREFLGTTAAAAVAVSSARLGAGVPVGTPAPRPLTAVVFDERFADSVQFAGEASRLGPDAYATAGNVTALFTGHLDARWRDHQAPVAGLTTADAALCLAQLARDFRMRVVYRGEHEPQADGVLHTLVCGQAAFEALISFEREASLDWPLRVARLVTTVPHVVAPAMEKVVTTTGRGKSNAGLVSWIIAPIAADGGWR